MHGLRILKNGEWNKPPILTAARLLLAESLAAIYKTQPLGNLAEFLNGTSYDTGLLNEAGSPIIRISNITDPSSSYIRSTEEFPERFIVNAGDLLVSWSASFKSIVWPGPVGVLNQHIFKVTEKDGFNRGFVKHMIEAAFDEMQKNVVGMGMMHLRRKDFLGHHVPSPPPSIQASVAEYLDWIELGCIGNEPTLPSALAEQRRIVAKIESLAAKIDEAKKLRQAIQTDAQAMLRSAFQQVIEGAEYRPMHEIAPIVRRPVEIEPDGEYPELGVRSFGKGTFHKPILNGIDVGTKKLYDIHPRDLVFSNVFAWEGAIAVVQPEDAGRVGSHRFITCVAEKGATTPEFLCFYLLTDEGIEKVREASPGGAGRNRTLGLKKLEKIKVPIPDYNKQLWFNRLQARAAAITRAQADNQTELDAMLPAILDCAFKGEL